MSGDLRRRIAEALGVVVEGLEPLSGGMVGSVHRATLAGGERVVAKTTPGIDLRIEARMLEALRVHLPVPAVHHADEGLLVLELLPGRPGADGPAAERHAAELLAGLHEAPAGTTYGSEEPTLLGPFLLPGETGERWGGFFARQRLLRFAGVALESAHLPGELFVRLERLAERCEGELEPSPPPALVHGDVWSGNVLYDGERITGFLDPATRRSVPEMELAFIDLFRTFGPAFHDAYRALRTVDPEYGRRVDLYQLPPLLVHVALFGAGYLRGVEERLERLGA